MEPVNSTNTTCGLATTERLVDGLVSAGQIPIMTGLANLSAMAGRTDLEFISVC